MPTSPIPTASSPANGSVVIPQYRPDTEGNSRATSAHRAKMTGRTNTDQKLTIGGFDSILSANLSDPFHQPWAVSSRVPLPVRMKLCSRTSFHQRVRLLARVSLNRFGFYSCPSGDVLSCAGWVSRLKIWISHWSFSALVPAAPLVRFPIKPSEYLQK